MTKLDDRIVIRIDATDYPDLYSMLYGAGPYKRAKVARRLLIAGYEAILSGKSKCQKNCGASHVDDRSQSRDNDDNQDSIDDDSSGGGCFLFDDDIDL